MEFEYLVYYTDTRLSKPNNGKIKRIKTANIKKWINDFKENNSPYVKFLSYEFINNREV